MEEPEVEEREPGEGQPFGEIIDEIRELAEIEKGVRIPYFNLFIAKPTGCREFRLCVLNEQKNRVKFLENGHIEPVTHELVHPLYNKCCIKLGNISKDPKAFFKQPLGSIEMFIAFKKNKMNNVEITQKKETELVMLKGGFGTVYYFLDLISTAVPDFEKRKDFSFEEVLEIDRVINNEGIKHNKRNDYIYGF